DLIMHSQAVKDPGGMDYIPGSLKAFGNDGNHFNDSIKAQPNTAVTPAVADALYYVSDHLPVIEKFKFSPVILPVELSSFYALCKDRLTTLVWTTESETNTGQFVLEQSDGNANWTAIDSFPAAYMSNLHKIYQTELNETSGGINYYRLKIADTDNSYVYSGVIATNCTESATPYLHVYPNPFKNNLQLFTNIAESELNIRDMLGRTYNYSATLIQTLPSGVYILFSSNHSVSPVKIIKE
ncbi:MAG TPA: T9SS type A sorting domain-containing protein, partial [Chitinophagales bacterium]|nr:T9SS type A sorting domain-containing protein [Chitinophagales bacterium]